MKSLPLSLLALAVCAQIAGGAVTIIPDTNLPRCVIMSGTWSSGPLPIERRAAVVGRWVGEINGEFGLRRMTGPNEEELPSIAMMVDGGPTMERPLYAEWPLNHNESSYFEIFTDDLFWVARWTAQYTPDGESGSWAGTYYIALSDEYCASLPEPGPGIAALAGLLGVGMLARNRIRRC